MGTIVLNPFEIFQPSAANQAGVFGGSVNGRIIKWHNSSFTNLTIELTVLFNRVTGLDQYIFNDWIPGDTPNQSIIVAVTTGDTLFLLTRGTDDLTCRYDITILDSIRYDIKFIFDAGTITGFLDGVPAGSQVTSDGVNIKSTVGAITKIGAFDPDSLRLDGEISEVKVTEVTTEYINLDWNNGDINTVPNIGANKLAGTDMTWFPAGSGTYVNV